MIQLCEPAKKEQTNPTTQFKNKNACWNVVSKVELGDYLLSLNFFSGIKVLVDRPHVINPKLLTAEIVTIEDIPFVNSYLSDYLTSEEFCEENIRDVLKNIDYSDKPPIKNIEKNQGQVIIRHVLPKQFNKYKEVLEVVVLDHFEECASFFPKKSDVVNSPITPSFPYRFKMIDKRIQLEVLRCLEDTNIKAAESEKWLIQKVLPKVAGWCKTVPKNTILPSIQLVPAKEYNKTLHHLKARYAKKFVEIWPTYNVTDPIKYVYEDLSIAAYLITLWDQERKKLNIGKKQSFVDLGCGHGLLDHILQSEGHNGIGIDLRKRKMWDAYGPETKLVEMTIEPSDNQLYPEYDWIIGNHPDELTPWIPVIAARSSYNMRAFLLPCCFFTFDGKYARCHQDVTQYQSYISFLKTLCEAMGFDVQLDRLRIPSTKRTCLVCPSRTYDEGDEARLETIRRKFIESHSKKVNQTLSPEPVDTSDKNDIFVAISSWAPLEEITEPNECTKDCSKKNTNAPKDCSKTNTAPKWVPGFIPRESVPCTQNCTGLDKKIKDETVMTIVNALLANENYVCIRKGTDSLLWNRGGVLKITSIFRLLNEQILKSMKNQSGGFQTLIRNHQCIFEVIKDTVQLRIPSIDMPSNSRNCGKRKRRYQRIKKQEEYNKKECFFYFHHPQGCPLSSMDCTFSHEELPMR